jgi:hypothetical protein
MDIVATIDMGTIVIKFRVRLTSRLHFLHDNVHYGGKGHQEHRQELPRGGVYPLRTTFFMAKQIAASGSPLRTFGDVCLLRATFWCRLALLWKWKLGLHEQSRKELNLHPFALAFC